MEQMKIDPDALMDISQQKPLSTAVRELQPALFREGSGFCCLLGPDPQAGIFGCGNTPEQAIADWSSNLKKRMAEPIGDDPVAQYVSDVFNSSKLKPW
jgi:hypothetical protein